jgi:exosortase/archaeosortase family protein
VGAHLALRATAVVALTLAAYQYSLVTLTRGLGLDSPLSYLGLIPLISLLLIAIRVMAPIRELDIHDRYLDYIIGVPLLAVAIAIVELAPAWLSSLFWLWRLDLVSLPLFVAGAISIMFGSRALWRLRLPVAFLFLAWPLPYALFVVSGLASITAATAHAVGSVLRFLPVAQAYPSDDGSLFLVTHHGASFILSVSSACSGANSMIGFLLIGGAVTTQMRGSRWSKLAWLAAGVTLMWAVDVVRILLILAAGSAFGEGFAIDTVHPVVGLVFVSFAVLAMVRVVPLFGLRLAFPHLGFRRPTSPQVVARQPAVRRVAVALVVVGLAGTLAATANIGMQRYQLLAEDLGTPRLQPATVARASVPGWTLSWNDHYPWVSSYFGAGATWDRYVYAPKPASPGSTAAQRPVFLDLISTGDLLTFSTYGLDACYRFHNYDVIANQTVQLGGGLTGHEVTYRIRPTNSAWTAVYWEWPVHIPTGDRYERIILSISTDYSAAAITSNNMRSFATEVVAASAIRATSEPLGNL